MIGPHERPRLGDGGPPVWIVPPLGSDVVGEIGAGDTVLFDLVGLANPASLDVDYITADPPPKGLTFDPETGRFSGVYAPGPAILSPADGAIVEVAEGQSVDFEIASDVPATAALTGGAGPGGVRLIPGTRRFQGVVTNSLPPPLAGVDPNGPVVSSPADGVVIEVSEGDAISLPIVATPQAGATSVRIIHLQGGPGGLRLNPIAARIEGVVTNSLPPPTADAPGAAPTIDGAAFAWTDGQAVLVDLVIAAGADPIADVALSGAPPAGLRLDPAVRRLVGTLTLAGRPSGTAFAWTITVTDVRGRAAAAAFTATVT